jgi:hypothetical protein
MALRYHVAFSLQEAQRMLRAIAEFIAKALTGWAVVIILWAFKAVPYDMGVAVLIVFIVTVDISLSLKLDRMDKRLSALADKLSASVVPSGPA